MRWRELITCVILFGALGTYASPEAFSASAPCPRFAYIKINGGAGLGHQVVDVAIGLTFAFQHRAEFLYDQSGFHSRGHHGAYPWLPRYLGLDKARSVADAAASGQVRHKIVTRAWQTRISGCNIMIEGCEQCCYRLADPSGDNTWCQLTSVGLFHSVQEQFRAWFAQSDPAAKSGLALMYNETTVNVAWHVRNGDVVLLKDRLFYDTLMSEIRNIVGARKVHYYFFSERPLAQTHPFILEYADTTLLHEMSEQLTFHHFVFADVLVTSGSSFPAAAAMLNSGIVLQAPNKDDVYGVIELFDQGIVNASGSLLRPSAQQLSFNLQLHLQKKSSCTANDAFTCSHLA